MKNQYAIIISIVLILFLFGVSTTFADSTQIYRGSQYMRAECSPGGFEIGAIGVVNWGSPQYFELEWFAIDRNTGRAYLITTTGDVWLESGDGITRWYATSDNLLVVIISTQYNEPVLSSRYVNYCSN